MCNIISNLMILMAGMMMMKMVTKMTKITKEDSESPRVSCCLWRGDLILRAAHHFGRETSYRPGGQLNFLLFLSFKFCPPYFLWGFIGYQRDLEDNLIFRFFFSFEFRPPYFLGGLLETRESWRTT